MNVLFNPKDQNALAKHTNAAMLLLARQTKAIKKEQEKRAIHNSNQRPCAIFEVFLL